VPFREEWLDREAATPLGGMGGFGGSLGEGGGGVDGGGADGEGLDEVSSGAASLPPFPGPRGRLSGAIVRCCMPLTGGATFVLRWTLSCMCLRKARGA
jgi:hypothetical protein